MHGKFNLFHTRKFVYLARIVHSSRHEMLTRIETIDRFLWFGKLHHRFLKIVQCSFDQNTILFVEMEQMVPNGLLGQHFRIANDNNAVTGPRQSHVQAARIVQETDALVLVRTYARHDDEIFLSPLKSIHASNFNILQTNGKLTDASCFTQDITNELAELLVPGII